MVKLIIESINIWTAAQIPKTPGGRGRGNNSNGQSIHGMKKVRELILELAVRGKLVAQNPNDEPASVLLEKIAKEKVQLIKEGVIKKKKLIPRISENEKPFPLPEGWEWLRLGGAGHDWGQKTPDKNFTYIDVSAIDNETGIIKSPNILSAAEAPSRARKIVQVGTVIYSTVRPYLKNIAVIEKEYSPEAIASTAFAILHPFQKMSSKYIASYLKSPTFVSYVEMVQTGIAYPAINDKQFFNGIIPIPPLAEQHRIAAKVDELMVLCNQLERHQVDSNENHQILVETLLSALTQDVNQKEFVDAWQRIADHFDTLFTTEASIEQLKQTILQLAVMGKLVPQDPRDEPASVLLEKIAKEKERLIKKGKIKKQKPLPQIKDGEVALKLPKGWDFVRLGDISNKIGSGSTPRGGKSAYVEKGIPFLRSQNVWNDGLNLKEVAYIPNETHQMMSNTVVLPNDVLLNITGASLGRCTIYPDGLGEANVSQHVTIIRPTNESTRFFLHLCLLSPYGQNLIWGRQVGMAREGLSKKVLELFEIPIPPLSEQHRIVAEVDKLIALCEDLKNRLIDAQTTRVQLADTIIEQAS
jgi:type I restriction enzyme S subunit